MATEKRVSICAGPSKLDLSVAMFHRPNDGEQHHKVRFTLQGGEKIHAVIVGVRMEDGSRESWLIEGWVPGGQKFSAYYETRRRTGYITYQD